MDVTATGVSPAVAVPHDTVETTTGVVAPQQQAQDIPVTSQLVQNEGGPSAVPPTQTTPAPVPGSAPSDRGTLAGAVAKLFSAPAPSGPISLDVSYRVQRDPNVIITVFTDPKTGREVAQFPPEILVHLSQFFDQPRGVTLDQSA